MLCSPELHRTTRTHGFSNAQGLHKCSVAWMVRQKQKGEIKKEEKKVRKKGEKKKEEQKSEKKSEKKKEKKVRKKRNLRVFVTL